MIRQDLSREGGIKSSAKNSLNLIRMREKLLPILEKACNTDTTALQYFTELISASSNLAQHKYFSQMIEQGGLDPKITDHITFDEFKYARMMAREHLDVFYQ